MAAAEHPTNGHAPTDTGGSKKLRICVLQSSYEGSASDMKDLDPYSTPEVYDTAGKYEWSKELIKKATAVQQIRDLARSGRFDVFLNLCDGAFDEDRAGLEVVQALDRYNCVYTGADAVFYEPSKELMKKMAYYYGIGTAPWAFVFDEKDLEKQVRHLRYPLIVKHYNGYSSVGMGRDSRVTDLEGLQQQVRKFLDLFGGALVEEFIEGREFTVLVAEGSHSSNSGSGSCSSSLPPEPVSFLPVECRFQPGESFKHFDLKWKDYESMSWVPCPAEDRELEQRLREMAKSAFTALRGCSYGRCDFRVGLDGQAYFLEINPNCGLFYPPDAHGSADYILTIDPSTSHAAFIDRIVQAALQRHARRQPRIVERFDPDCGFGLYSVNGFEPGEVIINYEERAHNLVTKSYVQRNWPKSSLKAQWFAGYAYPLTDEVYVTWSENPDDWRPTNHSCDPNAWVEGLDLVARRRIEPGEHISIDYATCCVENMADFDCKCGASKCRGRVTGSDYLAPWVDEVYGHHVGDYIGRKRREARGAPGKERLQQAQQPVVNGTAAAP